MRILIADDDRISRESHQQILALFGDVDVVVNGAEAVQKYKHALGLCDPYHLICLDISMPFFDGKYALDEIRKVEHSMQLPKNRAVKVIMVTSSRARADILQVKGKCDGYLVKPICIDAIEKMLNSFNV